MERLDAHRHFWRYNTREFGWIAEDALKRDFLPEDAASFDPCIAVEARQCTDETDWLLSLAETHPGIVRGVVGWLDLRSDGFPEQLERYAGRTNLVALRHVVQDEPDDAFILGEAFVRGVRRALAAGYAYDILVFERQLANATKFVDMLPDDARLVLDHMGKPAGFATWRKLLREMARRENVFVKMSGLVTEVGKVDFTPYLDTALEAFGVERVMFGSDWPVVSAHMPYAEWRGALDAFASQLTEEERKALFLRNAERFYLKQ